MSNKFEIDYFISRRGTHAAVAQEVAAVLEDVGLSSFTQDHDIPFGANFIGKIHDALGSCEHFIALLNADYADSPYTRAEWTNFYPAYAESGGKRRFIVVRVEDCQPPGLMRGIVYADLVGITLARVLCETSRYEEAEPLLVASLKNAEAAYGRSDLTTATRLNSLADLYQNIGRLDQAEAVFREIISIFEHIFDRKGQYFAASLNNLGNLLVARGRESEAEPLLRDSLAVAISSLGSEHQYTALARSNLAALLYKMGRFSEALPEAEESLRVLDDSLGSEHPGTKGTAFAYAAILRCLGHTGRAEAIAKKFRLTDERK